MDKSGHVLFPPTYEFIGEFCDGMAEVVSGGKGGFINAKGELVIPLQFSACYPFRGGLAEVMSFDKKRGLIDTSGRFISPLGDSVPLFVGGYYESMKDNFVGLIDKTGAWILPPVYSSIQVVPEQMLAIVSKGGKHGVVSLADTRVIDCQYDSLLSIDPEHFLASLDKKWSVLDKTGKQVYQLDFDEVKFSGKPHVVYFKVKRLGKWGLAQPNGTVELSLEYDDVVLNDLDQRCGAVKRGDKWAVLSPEMKVVTDFIYDEIESSRYVQDVIEVRQGDVYGLVNSEGKVLVPVKRWEVKPLAAS